jgi:hypothetical protein
MDNSTMLNKRQHEKDNEIKEEKVIKIIIK